jgi:hypothetical protein
MPYYLLKTNLHCNCFLKETTSLKPPFEAHKNRILGGDRRLESIVHHGTTLCKFRDPFKSKIGTHNIWCVPSQKSILPTNEHIYESNDDYYFCCMSE